MLAKERMSHPVICIHPEMSIRKAYDLMRKERVRRFPVVDKHGKLIGIVSERDLLHATPSPATTLNVWEITTLLHKIAVKNVMTRDVITISVDTPIEEAARIMADNKVGGLPVLRDDKVIGILTETDLFKVFLEMFGARDIGVRLTVLVPDLPGALSGLTRSISDAGGDILALGTFLGKSSGNKEVTIKVDGLPVETLVRTAEPHVERILDIRGTPLHERGREASEPARVMINALEESPA